MASCSLALDVADALQRRGEAATVLASTLLAWEGGGAVSVDTEVSAAQLRCWIAATVAVINAATSDNGMSSPVLALALPACSIEESAWVLLIASQPGWVFVPLDLRAPRSRLYETLLSCCADGLVTWDGSGLTIDGSTATPLPALCESWPSMQFYRLHSDAQSQSQPCWRRDPLLGALYVIPTSGTTAQAKGVVGTRVGALERVNWSRDTFPMDIQCDVVLRATRLTFVDAVAEILSACLAGALLVHLQFHSNDITSMPRVDSVVLHSPPLFVTAVTQRRITRFTVVPSVLRVLLHSISALYGAEQGLRLTSLQVVFVSGESLPLDVVDEFFRLLPHTTLVNLYGSTEVSGDVTWKKLSGPPSREQRERWHRFGVPIGDSPVLAIGKSTRIRLEGNGNSTGTPPVDALSELCVSGGAVASGYLVDKQVVRPPEKWTCGPDGSLWFRMGDLCRVVDGELFLCGRRDRQVKIRGNRVQLEDVERGLKHAIGEELALSDVVDVVVSMLDTAIPSTNQSEVSLVAFMVVRHTQTQERRHCDQCKLIEVDDVTMRRVHEIVVAQFGVVFVPRITFAIGTLDVPQRATGKINVSRLEEMVQDHLSHGSRTPRTTQYQTRPLTGPADVALALVEKVLALSQGLTDAHLKERTWLQLGGNSLQAAILSWELDQSLKISIPAHEVLEMTINELLKRLYSKKRRIECSQGTDTSPTSRRTVQHTTKRVNDTESRRSRPKWIWYSRYNGSSLRPPNSVLIIPAGSLCTVKLNLNVIAQADLGKCIDASPLIVRRQTESGDLDDKLMVLIGSHAGKFVCLQIDLVTHVSLELWSQTLDDRIEATATCCAQNGLVFVGTYSGRLYALDIASGNVVWQFQARDMIKSSALVVNSLALVVIGAYDQRLYGLDLTTGAVVWIKALPGSLFSTPLFISLTRQIVVATTTGAVMSWQLPTRDELQVGWETKLPAPVFASLVLTPLAADGNAEVLVGCADGVVYALNLSTGSVAWRFATQKPIFCTPCVYQTINATGDPTAIVGSHDGKLRKISTADGTRLWEVGASESTRSEPIFASPCVAALPLQQGQDDCGAVVCAATTSGRLMFLDQTTGREIPSSMSGVAHDLGEIFSSPVVVEDLCVVGTRSNQLFVFQLEVKCS